MYRTAKDRAADERQRAALWLFLQDRGLMADFLAFYRGLRDASLTDMANALRDAAARADKAITNQHKHPRS